jgi:peptidoglycan/LPS O-acetylase OafA/YrhL
MNIETNNQKYRRDIDGLRAVAVLAVVLFHAFPSTLPGGYVGVDIFCGFWLFG